MEKDKAEFAGDVDEYKLMYLMGEDNYTKYKEQVCSKDKNKTLTIEDLIIGLAQSMSQSFVEEYMKETALMERKIKETFKDSPKLKKYYIKCVERLFELFGKGMNAEKTSHLYKIFKEFNAAIQPVIETLLHKDLSFSKPSPKERVFIFNIQLHLIKNLFAKFHFEREWELKTWDDINSEDIRFAAEGVYKQFLNI
jgi:hypothetical protein